MKHRSRSTRHKSEFDFGLRTSYFGLHPLSAHPLSFSSVARCTAVPRSVTLLYSPATATLQLQLQPCACLCRAPASRLGLRGHRTGSLSSAEDQLRLWRRCGRRPSSASALSCCLVCGSDGLTDGLTDSMATTAMAAIGRRRVRAGGAFPGSRPSPSEHKVTQVREQAIGQYLGGVDKVRRRLRAGADAGLP